MSRVEDSAIYSPGRWLRQLVEGEATAVRQDAADVAAAESAATAAQTRLEADLAEIARETRAIKGTVANARTTLEQVVQKTDWLKPLPDPKAFIPPETSTNIGDVARRAERLSQDIKRLERQATHYSDEKWMERWTGGILIATLVVATLGLLIYAGGLSLLSTWQSWLNPGFWFDLWVSGWIGLEIRIGALIGALVLCFIVVSVAQGRAQGRVRSTAAGVLSWADWVDTRLTQITQQAQGVRAGRAREIADTRQSTIADINQRASARRQPFPGMIATIIGSLPSAEILPFDQLPLDGLPATTPSGPKVLRLGTLYLHGDTPIALPYVVDLPLRGPVILDATPSQRPMAVRTVQALLARVFLIHEPGKLYSLLTDPVGLGSNVAQFMELVDWDPRLVSDRAWTDERHIEERLGDLTTHMETVIQRYLRTIYPTIREFNEQSDAIREPFRVLAAFDLPTGISHAAKRRLQNIAENGERCGVYSILHVNRTDSDTEALHELFTEVAEVIPVQHPDDGADVAPGVPVFWHPDWEGIASVVMDARPTSEQMRSWMAAIGDAAKRNTRPVEFRYASIAVPTAERWSASTIDPVDVPIGVKGARDPHSLVLGKDTAVHALVVGLPGSGKTTLLHVLIAGMVTRYGPDEINLYLVDLKQGVEFKPYTDPTIRIPHLKAVAIVSEREFGVSILRGLDRELRTRGEMFRSVGEESLPAWRRRTGQVMPRIVLLVDEFQELFAEDDALGQEAGQLIDRIARQGRAFGIHMIMASQTLAGARTLAKSTMDLMTIRIALQCRDADSRLILAEDNPAARLLKLPGEAIYNAANGAVSGNVEFQVAWLSDDTREEILRDVHAMNSDHPSRTVVFEGGQTVALEDRIGPAHDAVTAGRAIDLWLGEPLAIAPPLRLAATSFRNLAVVGSSATDSQAVMSNIAYGLAVAGQERRREVVVADLTIESYLPSRLADPLARVGAPVSWMDLSDLERLIDHWATTIDAVSPDGVSRFLVINGLQRARPLRRNDDFMAIGDDSTNVADRLAVIAKRGEEADMHLVVWASTVDALGLVFDRASLRTFDARIALQMSMDDSSTFIDDASASRLGADRAILYDVGGERTRFRPFQVPSAAWLAGLTSGAHIPDAPTATSTHSRRRE